MLSGFHLEDTASVVPYLVVFLHYKSDLIQVVKFGAQVLFQFIKQLSPEMPSCIISLIECNGFFSQRKGALRYLLLHPDSTEVPHDFLVWYLEKFKFDGFIIKLTLSRIGYRSNRCWTALILFNWLDILPDCTSLLEGHKSRLLIVHL